MGRSRGQSPFSSPSPSLPCVDTLVALATRTLSLLAFKLRQAQCGPCRLAHGRACLDQLSPTPSTTTLPQSKPASQLRKQSSFIFELSSTFQPHTCLHLSSHSFRARELRDASCSFPTHWRRALSQKNLIRDHFTASDVLKKMSVRKPMI